jgi:putative hydrolase of HD superfamily
MYRMAMVAMMIPTIGTDRPLDIGRCVQVNSRTITNSLIVMLIHLASDPQMALVHDLAEAHVGDITPVEGVSPNIKHEVGMNVKSRGRAYELTCRISLRKKQCSLS